MEWRNISEISQALKGMLLIKYFLGADFLCVKNKYLYYV